MKVDKLSNKIPTDYSPETVYDWFTSWNAPTEADDIHVKVKVNKLNGKLATDNTPSNLIEEKLFSNIHSEKPDDSNWENPVLAWAQNNGLLNKPPIDRDDMYSSNSNKISFLSPSDLQKLGGNQIIKVTISSQYSIKSVRYLIDNVEIASSSSGLNFETSYDFSQLSLGNHNLTALAQDVNDVSFTAQITIEAGDNQAPAISNIKILPSSTGSIITFSTNENTTGYVKYSTNQSSLSSQTSAESSFLKEHPIQISGLSSNTKYYFQIVAQDSAGNSASSNVYNFTTLP